MAAYTQVYQAAVRVTADKLTMPERGALWTLTAYIGRHDTVIRDQQGLPMTGAEIGEALGMSRVHASRTLGRLVEAGALVERRSGRHKAYAFAPTLAHRYARRGKGGQNGAALGDVRE